MTGKALLSMPNQEKCNHCDFSPRGTFNKAVPRSNIGIVDTRASSVSQGVRIPSRNVQGFKTTAFFVSSFGLNSYCCSCCMAFTVSVL